MAKALQTSAAGNRRSSQFPPGGGSKRGIVLLAAGLGLTATIALVDLLVFTRIVSFFPGQDAPRGHWVFVRNSVPSFTPPALIRMAAIAAAAALLLAGVLLLVRKAQQGSVQDERVGMRVALVALACATATTLLLAASPEMYSLLAVEDGIVENLSALAFLACGVYAAAAAWRQRKAIPLSALFGLALLAVGFVVFAGEEISWGQRVIGFETPEAVAQRNWQDEMNLHNFYSAHFNMATYAGSALLFGLGHWLQRALGWPRGALSAFVPSVATAIAVAPSVAMNYPTFNLLAIALPLWLVVGALTLAAAGDDPRAPFQSVSKRLLWTTVAVIVLTQVVYLLRGASFLTVSRVGIASEYRELFVAFACLAYIVNVVARLAEWSPRPVASAQARAA